MKGELAFMPCLWSSPPAAEGVGLSRSPKSDPALGEYDLTPFVRPILRFLPWSRPTTNLVTRRHRHDNTRHTKLFHKRLTAVEHDSPRTGIVILK